MKTPVGRLILNGIQTPTVPILIGCGFRFPNHDRDALFQFISYAGWLHRTAGKPIVVMMDVGTGGYFLKTMLETLRPLSAQLVGLKRESDPMPDYGDTKMDIPFDREIYSPNGTVQILVPPKEPTPEMARAHLHKWLGIGEVALLGGGSHIHLEQDGMRVVDLPHLATGFAHGVIRGRDWSIQTVGFEP